MKYYDYEENTNKIPYDKEPIYRKTSYKKQKNDNINGKFISFIVSFLLIVNIVLGILLVKSSASGKEDTNNTIININSESNINADLVSSKAKASVVCVHAGYTTSSTDSPDYQGFFNMSSKGAGVIFKDNKTDGEAYIVTCFHVVKGYTGQIYVLLFDSFIPQKASLVYYSSIYDIAVIKVSSSHEYSNSQSQPADVADSSLVVEGELAVAVGNPLGTGMSVTSGIISKMTDLVDVDEVTHRVIRIDTPINSGNSGGGLFNNKGELIGLVSAKATDNTSIGSYIDCIAYAIPSNVAISIANNIIRNRMPVKAVIGFEMMVYDDPDDNSSGIKYDFVNGKYIPVQTIVVSKADSEGLFEIGDKLTAFIYGDTVVNITNLYSFDDHAFNISKGDVVSFIVEGKEKPVEVTIKEVISADFEDWYGK